MSHQAEELIAHIFRAITLNLVLNGFSDKEKANVILKHAGHEISVGVPCEPSAISSLLKQNQSQLVPIAGDPFHSRPFPTLLIDSTFLLFTHPLS